MKVPADELRSAPAGVAPEAGTDLAGLPVHVPAGSSARQVARLELRRQLAAWVRHEPGARLGGDPEELHQLRVAVRRVDAVLGVFKHQVAPGLASTRRTPKSILRTLGAVRDFDVQLAELDRYCECLSGPERAAAAPLRARLEAQRARARARMIRALDGEPTRHWLETLTLGSAELSAGDDTGAAPAAIVMPDRVQARFRKLRKAVRRLSAKSAMGEYHLVRRRAKHLRYALEPGAELFGKPAEEVLKALRRLQDGLGEHQDAHLAKDRLAAIAADASAALPAETLFLMGRLAEHHLNVTTRARKTLARAWDKVRGKRWKSLRSRMKQVSAAALRETERAMAARGAEVATVVAPSNLDPEHAAADEPRPLRH